MSTKAVFAWVKSNGWKQPAGMIYMHGFTPGTKYTAQTIIAEHPLSDTELGETLAELRAKYPCPSNWQELEGVRK